MWHRRPLFEDRLDAGTRLAAEVARRDLADPVVLALPRGGVPVAHAVARRLQAPLDVVLVAKLGVPTQPELAMGAVGESGIVVEEPTVIEAAHITERVWRTAVAKATDRLAAKAAAWRGGRAPIDVAGRTAVIVDDGIATGSTARAACQVMRARGAAQVIVAVPVAPRATVDRLGSDADDVIVLESPEPFRAIGLFYDDFEQVPDSEVRRLLGR